MEARRVERKKSRNDKIIEEIDEEEEDEEEEDETGGNNAEEDKKKVIGVGGRRGSGGYGVSSPSCQAERCGADLIGAKRYHRHHKVCEFHSKASVVMVAGLRQRFYQQCSRFHELRAFNEAKRSCRRRLAEHNDRRRKSTVENYNDGSKGHKHDAMEGHCTYVVDDRGRRAHQMNINSGSSGCKSFQIK